MKCFRIRAALRQIGLGIALVSIVVLLTTVFSLLGAISCAVLLGMIMGAARQWRRQAILVSLVVPAVTLVLAQVSQALTARQNPVFSMVCFGAFWMAYLMTCGLILLERKQPPGPVQPLPGTSARAPGDTPGPAALAAGTAPAAPPRELALAELGGKWVSEIAGRDGHSHQRVIEIAADRFVLIDIDPAGQPRCLAKGTVQLEKPGHFPMDQKTDRSG
jgi:hypothetical protein